jgi:hypothetical protein
MPEVEFNSEWIKRQWRVHIEHAAADIAHLATSGEGLEAQIFGTAASLHIALAAEIRAMLVEEF